MNKYFAITYYIVIILALVSVFYGQRIQEHFEKTLYLKEIFLALVILLSLYMLIKRHH